MTTQVALPSEGRILGISRHLGRSLGQARFIETQGVSTSAPKRLTAEGKVGSSPATRYDPTKHEFAVAIPEPDPPDKRKRPPRANREAPAFFGTWAAANSAYLNEELRSSVVTMWGRS